MGWRRKLPWIDALSGLTAGVLVLALRDVLTDFYSLPRGLLGFIAAVNIGYSTIGISLGLARRRRLLLLLVAANACWVPICAVMVARYAGDASPFGLAHIVGEAAYVAVLAALEWKFRREILGQTSR